MLFAISSRVSAQDLGVESFISALDTAVARKSTQSQQVAFLESINSLLKTPSFQASPYQDLFNQLADYSADKIHVLTTRTSPWSSLSSQWSAFYISIDWVDTQKLTQKILDWHNQERKSLGLEPYSYHSNLEKSATLWANQLRDGEITVNMHARNEDDGYYNYNSILEWFDRLWISFADASGGAGSFSESIWWWYYKCSKSDCTDSLIEALGSTWNFFMGEKNRNGDHYKAIASKGFSQVWFGVSVDTAKKRYYFVVHYWTNVDV